MGRGSWVSFATVVVAVLAAALAATKTAQGAEPQQTRLWKPVADEVYLQEVGEKVVTQQPITCVAVESETVYAVIGGQVQILRNGSLQLDSGAPTSVGRLRTLNNDLWALAQS